jgi:hypothetical protein
MASTQVTSSTVLPTRLLVEHLGSNDALECSVHNLPKQLLREFRHVFQDEYLKPLETNVAMTNINEEMVLIAIPTNQRAREDLVAIGDHIEKEKDRLLNVVRIFPRRKKTF